MELVDIRKLDHSTKSALVEELGFTVMNGWIKLLDGKDYLDPFTHVPVHIDHMVIVPGSVVILDDDPVSFLCYLKKTGRTLEDFSAA